MAKHTASASGTNKYRATPERKNIGTNTMQIESVETNAGTAICDAPSRMACTISLPWSMLRLMFSISTVASSTRIPTASARPPRVIMLMVWPIALRTIIDVRIESGIETAMISVLRQLPRNTRIMKPVRHAAMIASRTTPLIDASTKMDWSERGLISSWGGRPASICGNNALIPEMMSSVDASPFF